MLLPQVVLETSTEGSTAVVDSKPLPFYDLYVQLEKKGSIDFAVTGHKVDRPAEVKKGECSDRLERFVASGLMVFPQLTSLMNMGLI